MTMMDIAASGFRQIYCRPSRETISVTTPMSALTDHTVSSAITIGPAVAVTLPPVLNNALVKVNRYEIWTEHE